MAVEMHKCVICSEEVSKKKSYEYKGGRACKIHPEAVAANEAKMSAQKADLESHKRKPHPWEDGYKPEEKSLDDVMAKAGIRNPSTYCWHCDKEGLYSHIYAEAMLECIGKAKIQNIEANIFFPNDAFKAIVKEKFKKDLVVLKTHPISDEMPDWKLKQLVTDSKMVNVAKIVGAVVLCKGCADEFGFKEDTSEFMKLASMPEMAVIAEHISLELGTKSLIKDISQGKELPR